MRTLLLIDANSIIHRCFHALPPLSAPDGHPVQALYGISSMLLRLLPADRPDYAVACFDRPEPTFRKKVYALYKAQRPKAPDELISQIIEAHHLFEEFGIKTIEKPGFEADDIIATLATTFGSQKDMQTVILTGDLDTLQIVNDAHIKVRTFRKGLSDTVTYDEAAVRERYGLEPAQLIDYKTLVGDKSDNVPGVAGVGEKTATAILQKYGSLENFLKNLEQEPKYKAKFSGAAGQIESARFLVTVKKDVLLGISSVEEVSFSLKDKEELKKYFSAMGFESLIRRLEEGGRTREKIAIPQKPHNASLFGGASLGGGKHLPEGVSALSEDDRKKIFIIQEGKTYSSEDLQSERTKVGFGIKELSRELIAQGVPVPAAPLYDLGIAFWLLDPDFKEYRPEALSRIFLKEEWTGSTENYEHLYAFSRERMGEYGMVRLFETIEMPLIPVLARMERVGISVSRSTLEGLEQEIDKKLESLTREIHALAGESFNVNSPKQLGEVLYGKLGLASKKGAKVSTSAERLEAIRTTHPIVPLILNYREDFKIQSTYVRPLQTELDEEGRIHTEFVQIGTGTGRISSRNPNMQNIPQESVWAVPLRRAFVARPGFSFLSFDYSQLELRILAGLSGDRNMLQAFREGADIHRTTAAKVFGISEDAVINPQRRIAKALNFGLVYGMGSSAFAASSGISRREAQEFSEAYFAHFSGVARFIEETKKSAHRNGFVETLTGRRRYFPDINAGNPRITAENERQAVNHPVQGLEADFIKIAMIRVENLLREKKIPESRAGLILTIHDELLLEVESGILEEIIPLIKNVMQNVWPTFPVALTVEVSVGSTWGDMKKMA